MNVHRRAICNFVRIDTPLSLVALILLLFPVQPGYVLAQAPANNGRKVLVRVEPEYPDFFRNGHFKARIVAEATVLPNGNVSSVEIKGGNPMFAQFATKALRKWKYAPSPEQTVEQVVFNFNSNPQ